MRKYKCYYIEKLEGIHGKGYFAIYDINMMFVETIKGMKEAKQYINDMQ